MGDKVLIINTGGTIGMVHSDENDMNSPLRPAKSWKEVIAGHPILEKYETEYYQFDPLIDSSDMSPKIWVEIAKVIEKNYNKYRGFVVLHGTDTMAYTASALSFMLKNLSKPVVLTGSQVPLQFPRSDALQNLITAIEIAGNEKYGISIIPEVLIFFRDTLLRGNRSRKVDATNYFGFLSPNYLPIAEIGSDIRIKKDMILKPSDKEFTIDTRIDTRVIMLELFPGLDLNYIKSVFSNNNDIRGVILKTYGNGNAPTNNKFLEVLEYITSCGIVVVDITQCTRGFVKMGLYEASAKLIDAGVISGVDLTPEAAVTKLMYLLGKGLTADEVKKYMQIDICGEQTISQFDFTFENLGYSDSFEIDVDIPKELNRGEIIEAVVRIKEIYNREKDENLEIKVEILGNEKNLQTGYYVNNKVNKILEKDKMNFHGKFNRSLKRIIKNNSSVKIKIDTNMKIEFEKVIFSIYKEY